MWLIARLKEIGFDHGFRDLSLQEYGYVLSVLQIRFSSASPIQWGD